MTIPLSKKGFTLLEVILAITILTLAAGGSFVLIQQTVGSVSQVQSRLIASYLLQEGIEIIKNIRDGNWLKGNDFEAGLDAGDWEIDYNDIALTSCPFPCDYNNNLRFLKIDGQFYNYSEGADTRFKRKITISDRADLDDPPDGKIDKFKVVVEVLWKERVKIHSVSTQEFLYNWNK